MAFLAVSRSVGSRLTRESTVVTTAKRSDAIREQLNACLDEVAAINSICAKENRDPSAEELTTINANIGEDGQSGRAKALKASLQQAEKFEAEYEGLRAARRPAGVAHEQAGDVQHDTPQAKRFSIPIAAQRYKPRHVKGQDSDRKCYAFGRWFMAMLGHESSKQWCADNGYEFRAAMTEGFDSKGGFIVPQEFDSMLIDLRNEYGVARRACKVWPMGSDTKVIPRRTGGLTAYALGENATLTASDKTFDQIRLTAKKWGVLATYSSELSEDAVISIGDDLASEGAYALAYAEDISLFNGDGSSTYHGIVGLKNILGDASEYTAATGNTAFSTLDLDDFEGMAAKLPSYAYKNGGPKWYIHRAGWWSSMARLAAAAGGNTTREIQGGVQPVFLGYPVEFVEVMNSTLTAQTSTDGLVYFGNLGMAAAFGDRRGVAVKLSDEYGYATDSLAIRITERFDINVHDKGDASTPGSVIMLKTPGS